ncbi:methyltransferase domain-containing protein [Paracoccus aminovorans]|uniref:methyltransferase domain-containing protein n=1 Tax=Paracoccus aminovorans TaxID=34004 RepID=UPI000782CC6B|nr:methyltransferase domain-containing protein [Paracoccus aminovorans]MDQ7775911.1 methyltransferase domain-containing protein [Paracoccus aminovorans]
MMSDSPHPVPSLTDRAALDRNRTRAEALGLVDFLHRITADEIQDRLSEVNRRFTAPAVVTGHADFWRAVLPEARIVADTPVLDLAPGAHDLVIHAMALHWAEDPVGQIAQSARALRPDGLFVAACPGGRSLHELREALTRAEAEVAGGLSPRVLPMAEIRDLGGLLSRAGLALPVADQITQTVSYRSLFHLARDLRAMGEGNALAGRLRRPTRRDVLLRAAQIYAETHPDPQDATRIRATFELVFLTGWAPDASQQQPLRPGSAKVPLAEALASMRKPR